MTSDVEILLVEDNASDAEMTTVALKRNNLSNKLLHVKDGAAALDFIFGEGEYTGRNIENKPKVILLDLKMPKVDGIEVLREIKSSPTLRLIPVVMLTSSREEQDLVRSYELGVNAYVVKPVDFQQFMDSIRKLGVFWILVNEPPVGPAA